ncbi:50S ribosomal protein L25 [Candidatus Wolfebacteria bacterium]|nr:MAG: 50S ribosomal protein L25 [Candidatus Wolfebacteria bacterium]
MISLTTEARDASQKNSVLRAGGLMPAVFYGPKEENTPVTISQKEFGKVWDQAGESAVITLKTSKGDLEALIHDVDRDPVTSQFRHADFYIIEKGKKVQVAVPLRFEGESPAVKGLGANLVKVMHELQVEAMPKDLPSDIEVDLTKLDVIGSQIDVKDLKLPEGVTSMVQGEDVVIVAEEVKEEAEEESAAVDMDAIEVEQKGKGEEAPEEASKEDK